MAREGAAIIGSGTVPQTYQILPSGSRGVEPDGRGARMGVQVTVINPEDLNSVEAFVASGITVGTSPVEIVGPHTNLLPRCREIVIENEDVNNDVFISHKQDFVTEDAFTLNGLNENALSRITIPLLHNVSIYAKTASGTASIRMLIY